MTGDARSLPVSVSPLFQAGFDAFLKGLTFSQALRASYRPEGEDFYELSCGFNAAEALEQAPRPKEMV